MFQMRRDAIEAVCPERAVLAAFVPVRPVHEVIDQQLAAALEQLRKGLAAVRPVEDVLFLHLHPRQCAALLAQSVALPGKLLLFGQKPRTGIEPLILRNDRMISHGNLMGEHCGVTRPHQGNGLNNLRTSSPVLKTSVRRPSGDKARHMRPPGSMVRIAYRSFSTRSSVEAGR